MADQTPIYDELNIRIQPREGNRYHTLASAPDGSTASGTFVLPFNETEVDNFVLRVGRQRLPVRSYRSAQMEEAKRFGSRLFEALMVDDVRDVFRSARAVAERSQKGLRVTLCLTDAPELMEIPWEFLYEKPRFLAQSIYSPVVRSLDLGEVPAPHPLNLPLSVLGMISSPRGFGTLDVEAEKEKLVSALSPLCERGAVTIDWLESGTLRELDEAISRNQSIHVFHYIGHGAYDKRADGGILALEDEYGEPHEVSGEELGLLLQDERGLRLAVLNSCEGARSSHLDPFSGVGSSLVQYGIPAVIGMQFEITDEAAIAFASRLYASLAQGFPVDAALAQARRSIFAAGNDIEFGTPVLFLRGADAQLFEVIDSSPADRYEPPSEAYLPPPEPSIISPDPEVEPVEHAAEQRNATPAWMKNLFGFSINLWWIPKPWRDWLTANVLNRFTNGKLALFFVALFILGTLVGTIFGHETASGSRQSAPATVLLVISFFGLIWVGLRVAAKRLRRLRDWWTGQV